MRKFIALIAASMLVMGISGTALATKPDPEHKVGICHRTASDTNPYVYIEVDEAALSPGHLDNDDPGHKPTYWKSDGTFRGVVHKDGDPKDDYLAKTATDCEDFTPTPSPKPSPTPTPVVPTPTPVVPTPTPVVPTPTPPTPTPTPTPTPPTPTPTPEVTPEPEPSELPSTDTIDSTGSGGGGSLPILLIVAGIVGLAASTLYPRRAR